MTEFSNRTGIPVAGSAARAAERAEPRADAGLRVVGGSAARRAASSGTAEVSDVVQRPAMASILQTRKRERIFTPRPTAGAVMPATPMTLEREHAPASGIAEGSIAAAKEESGPEPAMTQTRPGILKQFFSGIFST